MKKILIAIVGLSTLCLVSSLFAQELKIGVVDFQKVMKTSPKVTRLSEQMKKEFEPQQKELVQKQKDLNQLISKYNRDATILQASEKQKMQQSIQSKGEDLNRQKETFNEKFFKAQQSTMQKLMDQIKEISAQIAKTRNLDLIIPKDNLLYSNDRMDVTNQVIDALR